ncbi:MAG TPA: peptide chain release factor N(5)-glutamine methyltransferase [Parvularculaceae bacterium]|nr:peptide chain release factor N(5)-glutamine methyltransferase [Parvularculaceae bacterium]
MTLDQYLRAAAARLGDPETPRLDARVLAKHVLHLDDTAFVLAWDRRLNTDEIAALDAAVARRAAGEPVAHIIGEKEFYGLTFKLAPGLLVPRPDSETVIEAVRKRRPGSAPLRILDLGTGTGCLLLSLLSVFPKASGVGVDINPLAARTARENAAMLGLGARAQFIVADWGAGLAGTFDIIVANPPYIEEADFETLAVGVRGFEDRRALLAGEDGLDAYRSLFAAAPRLLTPSGLTVFELGEGQSPAVAALAVEAFPGAPIFVENDLEGRERVIGLDLSAQKKD